MHLEYTSFCNDDQQDNEYQDCTCPSLPLECTYYSNRHITPIYYILFSFFIQLATYIQYNPYCSIIIHVYKYIITEG